MECPQRVCLPMVKGKDTVTTLFSAFSQQGLGHSWLLKETKRDPWMQCTQSLLGTHSRLPIILSFGVSEPVLNNTTKQDPIHSISDLVTPLPPLPSLLSFPYNPPSYSPFTIIPHKLFHPPCLSLLPLPSSLALAVDPLRADQRGQHKTV